MKNLRALVLGAGLMGRAIGYDLVRSDEVSEVVLADISLSAARDAVRWIGSKKARAIRADVCKSDAITGLMGEGFDVAIGAVSYRFNRALAHSAVESGVSFCDLGGNNDIVDAELALDKQAKAAGVTIVPDCGLAPGMVSILAARGIELLGGKADDLHIRVGGLPRHPRPPLEYKIVFSPEGLVNEYLERSQVIRDGKLTEVESLSEVESIEFPSPYGELEAFTTSGGASTLPRTMLGKVNNLDYKTIRYPGHCVKMKAMFGIGLASSEEVEVGGKKIVPRELFTKLLRRTLTNDDTDAVLLRVTASRRGKPSVVFQLVDEGEPSRGISAMMRTTAFPASAVAWMLGTGRIAKKGALPQELCIPAGEFIKEVRRRDVLVKQTGGEPV